MVTFRASFRHWALIDGTLEVLISVLVLSGMWWDLCGIWGAGVRLVFVEVGKTRSVAVSHLRVFLRERG